MQYHYHYNTLIGDLTIVTDQDILTNIIFGKESMGQKKETPVIKEVKKNLDEYFKGTRRKFDIPFKMKGTPFQIKVWKELTNIKYGECISYQELAHRVSNKNYARAVGMANNRNPLPIIIPCHRVIGKNGDLVGFGGGLHIKAKLINLEANQKIYDER